jgi:mono/diheme cytochrome c family protein
VCAKCHGLAGEGDLGPAVAQSPALVDAQSLEGLLEDGQDTPGAESYMPPVGRGWPEFQVQALVEYIRSNETLAAPQQPAEDGER